MKIKMPAGFEPPQGVKPGDTFDAVATICQKKDGSYELESIDGAPMDGEDDDDDKEESEAAPAAEAAPETPPMMWQPGR